MKLPHPQLPAARVKLAQAQTLCAIVWSLQSWQHGKRSVTELAKELPNRVQWQLNTGSKHLKPQLAKGTLTYKAGRGMCQLVLETWTSAVVRHLLVSAAGSQEVLGRYGGGPS